MPGKYKKAPLVYMTAQIKTTTLPTLTSDQWALVEQAMVKNGFPIRVSSDVKEVSVNVPNEPNQEPVSSYKMVPRHGFFSADRRNSIIIDVNGIEWRTSQYSRYSDECSKIRDTLHELCSAVDAFNYIPAQELSLSYADLIAPTNGRALSDYFSKGNQALPLEMLNSSTDDIQCFGNVQIERIVEPNKRIFVSLEELPTIDGRLSKMLPQSMMEPDQNLTMPLNFRNEWEAIESKHFALLTTQAALLTNKNLSEFNFEDECAPIHELTRDTFNSLINHDVCNVDWEYMHDDQGVSQ